MRLCTETNDPGGDLIPSAIQERVGSVIAVLSTTRGIALPSVVVVLTDDHADTLRLGHAGALLERKLVYIRETYARSWPEPWLRFVMGHELAHLELTEQTQALEQRPLDTGPQYLAYLSAWRRVELQCDVRSVHLTGDPDGAIDFFRRGPIQQHRINRVASKHPRNQDRIRAINAVA